MHDIKWIRENPAAFDAEARKAATGTGEPSYVSGAQNWNGTALTLNANPATMNRIDANASVSRPCGSGPASTRPISARFRLPVSP